MRSLTQRCSPLIDRLLVCLDGSDPSEQLIPYAVEIGQRCNATAVLLRVMEPALSFYGIADGIAAAEEYRYAREREYLEEIGARLREAGVGVDYAVVEGSPGETIVAFAARSDIDLILLATHSKRVNIGSMVFGSVADHVLRNADIPVMTIKPIAS